MGWEGDRRAWARGASGNTIAGCRAVCHQELPGTSAKKVVAPGRKQSAVAGVVQVDCLKRDGMYSKQKFQKSPKWDTQQKLASRGRISGIRSRTTGQFFVRAGRAQDTSGQPACNLIRFGYVLVTFLSRLGSAFSIVDNGLEKLLRMFSFRTMSFPPSRAARRRFLLAFRPTAVPSFVSCHLPRRNPELRLLPPPFSFLLPPPQSRASSPTIILPFVRRKLPGMFENM